MLEKPLPEEFRDLQAWSADWSLATEPERIARRYSATLDEAKGFYDAVRPRLEAALTYLNRAPLERLSEPERRLLYLTFMFAEVSLTVEVFGTAGGVPYGYDPMRYVCTAAGNPSSPYGGRRPRRLEG